jgi:ZIP zinc/iron transport family
VLLATAFVHLLPTAFVSMTDPCLPRFWNKGYPAMPGLIAMISVFVVVTIEMFFATRGAGHSHSSEWDTIPEDTEDAVSPKARVVPFSNLESGRIENEEPQPANGHVISNYTTGSAEDVGSRYPKSPKRQLDDEEDLDLDELDPIVDESAYLNAPTSFHRHRHDHGHSQSQHSEQNPQKLFLQCLLLEAGILFHSIFIGMAVSVATGTEFIVLLIAISFHQTFEGLALGSRISALIPSLFDASSPKPWLMALAYGTTTPIGQAIGLWMHELYDPASMTGLLMVGITNAISSGLLLFAGLVQLLSEDFLSDKSYEVLKGKRRIEACISVALGGALMAFVGAFA